MEKAKKILVVNLGSTSTKVCVYESDNMMISESVSHSAEELKGFKSIFDQYDLRKNAILGVLQKNNISLDDLDAIASRGGNTKPIPGGIYTISMEMINDGKGGKYGQHPNIIGEIVSYDLGKEKAIPALTVDPPTTDELCVYARYSGIP